MAVPVETTRLLGLWIHTAVAVRVVCSAHSFILSVLLCTTITFARNCSGIVSIFSESVGERVTTSEGESDPRDRLVLIPRTHRWMRLIGEPESV